MRKIAILGMAPSWKDAPFHDTSWEIWGLSRLYVLLPRWDKWFELHKLEEICRTWEQNDAAAEKAARKDYTQFLKDAANPVYLSELRPDMVPAGQLYPVSDILAQFRPYFTSTVSWMIALAIHEGVDEIGLWGVDMELSGEYSTQRPSCEYFIGIAEGRGIKVTVPESSGLLKASHLYGFQPPNPLVHIMKEKLRGLMNDKAQGEAQVMQTQLTLAGIAGAKEIIEYVEHNW